jgi:hypothetical protein
MSQQSFSNSPVKPHKVVVQKSKNSGSDLINPGYQNQFNKTISGFNTNYSLQVNPIVPVKKIGLNGEVCDKNVIFVKLLPHHLNQQTGQPTPEGLEYLASDPEILHALQTNP